jgi:hypothetical protein
VVSAASEETSAKLAELKQSKFSERQAVES